MTSPGRIAFNVCPNLTAIMQCLITKARKKGECTLQPCFAQLLEIRTWNQNWHSVHVKIRNLQHCSASNREDYVDAFCFLVAHMTRVLAHDDQCVN